MTETRKKVSLSIKIILALEFPSLGISCLFRISRVEIRFWAERTEQSLSPPRQGIMDPSIQPKIKDASPGPFKGPAPGDRRCHRHCHRRLAGTARPWIQLQVLDLLGMIDHLPAFLADGVQQNDVRVAGLTRFEINRRLGNLVTEISYGGYFTSALKNHDALFR